MIARTVAFSLCLLASPALLAETLKVTDLDIDRLSVLGGVEVQVTQRRALSVNDMGRIVDLGKVLGLVRHGRFPSTLFPSRRRRGGLAPSARRSAPPAGG